MIGLQMPVAQIDSARWTGLCASRIAEVDQGIDVADAARIARNMRKVERLSAMAPEAAVAFVLRQMDSARPELYDRRNNSR